MYFKAKNNLERVVDELKSRNADINNYDCKEIKKNNTATKFQPRKT